ncbi:putative oxidoreductase [Lachnellula suecica]|uniref:Putative oxidoreductase n=1 Tax=Lachnellula suecica TaxID=602035 RepID=A0A8T9C0B8_9HELO|nr:putative oxidoreductase [Lachnellula suecica]
MPTYVITGTSRGLGYEILRQTSSDPNNTIIGLVRDKASTEKKISEELSDRKNIHIFSADVTSYDDLKKAAEDTAAVTGGKVDYLIANAGYKSTFDPFDPIGVLDTNDPMGLTADMHKLVDVNVIGNIHFYTAFIPLLLKGTVKKAICITTGMSDIDTVNSLGIDTGALYSISKAAMNMVTAKFNAQYKSDGVLFLGICPGVVDVGDVDYASCMNNFSCGPTTPEASVKDVINVWENASVERSGGDFISHLGSKQWL